MKKFLIPLILAVIAGIIIYKICNKETIVVEKFSNSIDYYSHGKKISFSNLN